MTDGPEISSLSFRIRYVISDTKRNPPFFFRFFFLLTFKGGSILSEKFRDKDKEISFV